MKVLDDKPFALEFTCRSCGSKLEAAAEDVRIHEDPPNCDDWERWPYVTCPVCEQLHRFDWNKMTPKVQKMAYAASKQ